MKTKLLESIAGKTSMLLNNLNTLLPNPNLHLAEVGDKTVTLNNILMDPHVASCIQTRKSGVKNYCYEVQGKDVKIVDFCNTILDRINISNLIDEIMNAVLWGYNVFEIMYWYDYINGTDSLVPHRIVAKPIEWFQFDEAGMCRFVSANNPFGKVLPPNKFIIVQHNNTYENPYGESVLSKCLWSVVIKKTDIMFWLRFTEKFGMPHLVGKTNGLVGSDEYDKFLKQLDDLAQDGSAVIDALDDISVINGSSSVSVNIYKELIDFCNTEISKAILSQTLTTELNGVGSYAAGAVHYDVLNSIIEADKVMVEKAVNRVLEYAVSLNFDTDEMPKFIMYPKEDVDKPLAEITDLLTKSNQIKFTKKFYTNRFGFKDDEFELIETTPTTAKPTEKPNAGSQFAEKDSEELSKDQIIIDSFVDKSVELGDELYTNLIKSIEAMLDEKQSFEETKTNIHGILPKLDTGKLEQNLINILFLADVIGRVSVNQEIGDGK